MRDGAPPAWPGGAESASGSSEVGDSVRDADAYGASEEEMLTGDTAGAGYLADLPGEDSAGWGDRLTTDAEDAASEDGDEIAAAPQVAGAGRRQELAASAAAHARHRPPPQHADFPRQALAQVADGLHRAPSWTVYPSQLAQCLAAAARLAQLPGGASEDTKPLIRQLVRDVAPSAFDKCLEDANLHRWEHSIQANILEATLRLVDLAAVTMPRLALEAHAHANSLVEAEDDVLPLLTSLCAAFDPDSEFHRKHHSDPLPRENVDTLLESITMPLRSNPGAGTSRPVLATDDDDLGNAMDRHDEQQYLWLSHLLNYFAAVDGFSQVLKFMREPDSVSLRALELIVRLLSKAAIMLAPVPLQELTDAATEVLRHAARMLADGSRFGDDAKTRDMQYVTLSRLLRVLRVFGAVQQSEDYDRNLYLVQQELILSMLRHNVFNMQLIGVREINAMLTNAAVRQPEFAGDVIEWVERKDLLRHLVSSYLHHKAYVDQVRQVMKSLLEEERLKDEHLDLVWAMTEKSDTHEAVKHNVFDLLAELAWHFSVEQVDGLFDRFERSWSRRDAADSAKLLEVVRRLAHGDQKGLMSSRVLELLWKMVSEGDGPPEALVALTETLDHYSSMGKASKEQFAGRCLSHVKEQTFVVPSLRVLSSIIRMDGAMTPGADESPLRTLINFLESEFHMVELLVSSLEMRVQVANSRMPTDDEAEAASSALPGEGKYSYEEGMNERSSLLLYALRAGHMHLDWPTAERLWVCLIEGAPTSSHRDHGFQFFREACTDVLRSRLHIELEACTRLLQERVVKLPPAKTTPQAFHCISHLVSMVAIQRGQVVIVNDKSGAAGYPVLRGFAEISSVLGLPYMWEMYLQSLADDAATMTSQWLLLHYNYMVDSNAEGQLTLHAAFLTECVRRLSDCVTSLDQHRVHLEGGGDAGLEGELLSQRTQRLLRIVESFILANEMAPRATVVPNSAPHSTTFAGRQLVIDITSATRHPGGHFSVVLHTNEFVSGLRRKVAAKLGLPPNRTRLLHGGRELNCETLTVKQLGLQQNHVVGATQSQADMNLGSTDVEHEPLRPRLLLAQQPEVYDVLFRLAEAPWSRARVTAQTLLGWLPTRTDVRTELCTLLSAAEVSCSGVPDSPEAQAAADNARSRFRQLFQQGPAKMLYTIQVLDALLFPANLTGDWDVALAAQRNFLLLEPTEVLIAALAPDTLTSCMDLSAIRSSYVSGLRLLNLSLFGPKQGSEPGAAGAASDAASEDLNPLKAGQKVRPEAEPFLEVATKLLLAVAWVVGMGQLDGAAQQNSAHNAEEEHVALHPDDLFLSIETLQPLQTVMMQHNKLAVAFLADQQCTAPLVDLLLRCGDAYTRARLGAVLIELCEAGTEGRAVAQNHVLPMLLNSLHVAQHSPRRCEQYFTLLCRVLQQHCPPETSSLHTLLTSQIAALCKHKPVLDESDQLLSGTILLVLALVRALDQREVTVDSGESLAQVLMRRFLFPELLIITSSQDLDMGAMDGALQAVCSTHRTRTAAFALLQDLATHCTANMYEVVSNLMQLHYYSRWSETQEWEHLPDALPRPAGGYVGLQNAGATCYMNSVFQQLYMQPEVRRHVLMAHEPEQSEQAESIHYQLQSMFGALFASRQEHFSPCGFWMAFKDYDGTPVNVREHQDALEFFNRLQDQVDSSITRLAKAAGRTGVAAKGAVERVLGGKFAQQIICRKCPKHRSEREEDFTSISVDVRHKRNLEESLASYVQGELLEGDNQWLCEACGAKVDAVKRGCVKELPHTLLVHLKRFEFDYESMQHLKVKDRFEFPDTLNMCPYTVESLEAEFGGDAPSPKHRPEYYQYRLAGIVVHSGTAFAGHYYSYIREREEGASTAGKWFVFDDKRVEPWDTSNMERDCFGGKYSIETYDAAQQVVHKEYDRPNSAFMLFYEREDTTDLHASWAAAEREQAEAAAGSGEPAGAAEVPNPGPAADEHVSVPNPNAGPSGPQHVRVPKTVWREVVDANLHHVFESHLMSADYFTFLRTLVESNNELYSRKMRRYGTGSLARTRPNEGGDDIGSHSADQAALYSIQVATEFLCKVYLRAHSTMREDLSHWQTAMHMLIESNVGACRWFLHAVEQSGQLRSFLIKCPSEDVRSFFAQLLFHALACALKLDDGTLAADEPGDAADPEDGARRERETAMLPAGTAPTIDRLVEAMAKVYPSNSASRAPLTHVTWVLLEYAKFGAPQRQHLLRHGVLPQLLQIISRRYASSVAAVSKMQQMELSAMSALVSLLVRGCAYQSFEGHPPVEPSSLASRDVEGPLIVMPQDVLQQVYGTTWLQVLFELAQENDDLSQMLEYLAWWHPIGTKHVLEHLVSYVMHSDAAEIPGVLLLAERLLTPRDARTLERAQFLMLGSDPTRTQQQGRTGLLGVLTNKAVSTDRRFELMTWVVRACAGLPELRPQLVSRSGEWHLAVEMLQEELAACSDSSSQQNSWGPPPDPPLAHSSLNVDWTLTRAAGLLEDEEDDDEDDDEDEDDDDDYDDDPRARFRGGGDDGSGEAPDP